MKRLRYIDNAFVWYALLIFGFALLCSSISRRNARSSFVGLSLSSFLREADAHKWHFIKVFCSPIYTPSLHVQSCAVK
ncbi:hypothetical protein K437DRAFT_123966 [Tilletiaria anomala UBC 951]|uniref:Uncharacterized protein n=1 Tax=Tilletiaria anomala (strain ATCC 24038 / CBS 436.72 / UBC 951) TaxID=1037660 RepID=A0A066VUS1_TILAU|nr:uncharacterized protein K437DRAFT_123966 [Tilletiaria anomala UBC 951]KDN45231.1 hypothetical protein K437DRAFT_123966 [Tilletiaria anomala UBC 951]